MTYSPNLPQGLNLGRQLYFLQRGIPSCFARVAHILLYPQYWSWRLSGVMASEVTSLGTHTDLWRPHDQSYSTLARKQGWARLMPSMHRATEQLGPLRAGVAAATGLPARCVVACGIHDSNASYLRFLMDREREAFTVVSSGTWTIVMANRGDLRAPARRARHARQRQRVRRAHRHRALHGRARIRGHRAGRRPSPPSTR